MEAIITVNNFLREGGWLAVLIFVLFSGYKGWWQFGTYVATIVGLLTQRAENAERERDDWKEIAKGYAEVAEVTVVEKKGGKRRD
jgi:hypothetical protein